MFRQFSAEACRRRTLAAWIVAWAALFVIVASGDARAVQRLSTEDQLRRLSLTRAWFAQVRVDPARHRVERAVLTGDRLTVLTTAGVVQELNALTGETLWIAEIGNPAYPSLGPAANEQYVALVNGSTLYVLNRMNGRPVISRRVGGAPGAAPALGRYNVFVPLVSGRIEGYPLGKQTLTPWYYQSYGRAMVAPIATPQSCVWATDSGHLYVGRAGESLGVRFRLETGSEFVAPPAFHPPYLYAATMSGEVFGLHEMTGARRWKYATGFSATRAPAAFEQRVFVTSDEPVLHCIDATTGAAVWEAPTITQFAAMSRERVYAVDEFGAMVTLDAATGAILGRMQNDVSTFALVNDQTDRVYVVSIDGKIQCLHEIGAAEPLYHRPAVTPPAESAESEELETTEPAETTPLDTGVSPFDEPAEDAEMPAEETPFGDDDNLFDF